MTTCFSNCPELLRAYEVERVEPSIEAADRVGDEREDGREDLRGKSVDDAQGVNCSTDDERCLLDKGSSCAKSSEITRFGRLHERYVRVHLA